MAGSDFANSNMRLLACALVSPRFERTAPNAWPGLDFAECVFAPDLHCHLGRERWIYGDRKYVVEGAKNKGFA